MSSIDLAGAIEEVMMTLSALLKVSWIEAIEFMSSKLHFLLSRAIKS